MPEEKKHNHRWRRTRQLCAGRAKCHTRQGSVSGQRRSRRGSRSVGRCCYNGLERTPYADEGVDLRLSGFVVPRHSRHLPACYHFQREQFRRYL